MAYEQEMTQAMMDLTETMRAFGRQQGMTFDEVNKGLDGLKQGAQGAATMFNALNAGGRLYDLRVQQFNQALSGAGATVGAFGKAITDTTVSFSKYNTALTTFGAEVESLGKLFGRNGAIIGGALNGMAKMFTQFTNQADNITKAFDDLGKVGVAGGILTNELLQMGHDAGLTSKNLTVLTNVMKSNSQALQGLTGDFTSGAKVFGQITAVGTQTVATYSKLGITQEELIKTQGDYVALQIASGNSLKNELRDKKALQEASLQYVDNLLVLAKLSGEDIDTVKKRQKEASMELSWQMANYDMEKKAAELRRMGTAESKAQADALDNERTARQRSNEIISAQAPELAKAMRELQARGTAANKETQNFLQRNLGPEYQQFMKDLVAAKGDKDKEFEINQRLIAAYDRNTLAFGSANRYALANPEFAARQGYDADMYNRILRRQRGGTPEEKLAAARAQIEAAKGSGEDTLLDNRATMIKTEKDLAIAYDNLLKKANPLISGFSLLTFGALAAAGAIGALASAAGLAASRSMFGGGGFPGGLGGPGSMMPPGGYTPGGPSSPIGAGAAAGGASRAAGLATAAGGIALRVAGGALADTAAGALGLGRNQINSEQDEANWKRMTTGQKFQSGIARGIETAGSFFGLGNMANEAKASRIKSESEYLDKKEEGKKPVDVAAKAPSGSQQSLLDFIGNVESKGDYNVLVGGRRADLTNMTVAQVLSLQANMIAQGHESTAVGKYQIVRKTLLGIMNQVGVNLNDKFDKSTQDRLGLALLKNRGLDQYLDKKLSPNRFADNLAMEWASLPTSNGRSFYSGVGSNKALTSRDELVRNLPQAANGGVFSGPNSGYLVALHGREMVTPTDRLSEMMNNTTQSTKTELSSSSLTNITKNTQSDTIRVMYDMIDGLQHKFDELIYVVQNGNNTQKQLLKYSKA